MTRLVSVTRILNEDDIVEAFVRHNICHLDHMIFLDDGSSDRTLEILKDLKGEGLALAVFQGNALSFNEVSANTWLYRLAGQVHATDWVVFLDADEFLRVDTGRLADMLDTVPAAVLAVTAPLVHYYETPEDDPAELVIPLKMRWRQIAAAGTSKMLLRGGFGVRLVADAGNHGALLDGRVLAMPPAPHIALAHYPRRSGWQNLQKSVIGWLKVLAAGDLETSANRSAHYRQPFEFLRDAPEALILNENYLRPGVDRTIMEDAPLAYLGGDLRYTTPSDPALRALTLGLRYAEQLARQHGRLLDDSEQARRLVESWNTTRSFLF